MYKFATIYQAALKKAAGMSAPESTSHFLSNYQSPVTANQLARSEAKRRAMMERGAAAQRARSFKRPVAPRPAAPRQQPVAQQTASVPQPQRPVMRMGGR